MIDNVLFNVENIIILSKSVNHLHGMDLHIPFGLSKTKTF